MSSIVVGSSQWPVLRVVWDGEQTDADIDAYFRETRRALDRKQRYVTLTWMRRYKNTREHQKRIATFMQETEAETKQYNQAAAIITRSLAFRFVLSTVLLIKPIPIPYRVCGTFADGLEFVRGEAEKHGLLLPFDVAPLIAD